MFSISLPVSHTISLFLSVRFAHDDGTCTSSLSSHVDGFVSVGAESGVVSIFKAEDVVARDGREVKQVRSLMNLTTKITSAAFHPSGQVLAVASNQVILSPPIHTPLF
jgi:hypothetical protein